MPAKILTAIEYVLGENAVDYGEAEGFETSDLPRKPELWGWGRFHRASSPVVEMQIAAAARTLAHAGLDPRDVDRVIMCHANPPDEIDGPGGPARRVLEALGLDNAFPLGVTSGGCGAMLTGVDVASAMLSDGRVAHVLVVAGDRTPKGTPRFQRYGIFSDAACACLVSSGLTHGFEIVRSAFVADHSSMRPDASFNSELALWANARMFADLDVTAASIRQVFGTNVFLPITLVKELEAGFTKAQVYVDNVKRIGHCYSADALINLADYQRSVPIVPGDYFVTVADAPGLRATILLKASAKPAWEG